MAKSSAPTFEVVHDQTGERAEVTYEEYEADYRWRGFHTSTPAGGRILAEHDLMRRAAEEAGRPSVVPVNAAW